MYQGVVAISCGGVSNSSGPTRIAAVEQGHSSAAAREPRSSVLMCIARTRTSSRAIIAELAIITLLSRQGPARGLS